MLSSNALPPVTAAEIALPAMLSAMVLMIGLLLVSWPTRHEPFVRLSQSRTLSLAIAVLGVALCIYSLASVVFFAARCRDPQSMFQIPDHFDLAFFDSYIGHAVLTRRSPPLGIGPIVVGASFVVPKYFRTRRAIRSCCARQAQGRRRGNGRARSTRHQTVDCQPNAEL